MLTRLGDSVAGLNKLDFRSNSPLGSGAEWGSKGGRLRDLAGKLSEAPERSP